MPRSGYGHMVLDDYVARVRALRQERAQRLAALIGPETGSPSAAHAYQARAREAIRAAFGPWPERTPLNARVTGALDPGACRIEKLTFESRPGRLVTANLYLPKGLKAPAPGVIGTCGHSADGKASALYQGFCQRLAASGFVTLIFDPFNQGERDQYWGLSSREAVASCTQAHNMMGKQLELVGDWFGAWRAWDGIRALDYLLARPEVDATRVGLTGNSGGGTMTTWLWAVEERFTMAAPSCFVTTFLHNLENELPADCEQYPPGVLGAGLEMADFVIARAPDPVLLLGQHYDYFDRRGHQEAFDEVQRVYRVLGAPEGRLGCYRGPHGHGFHRENQEAMVAFFCQHAGRPPVAVAETEALPEPGLWATPTGQVMEAGARPIYAMIAERATELTQARPRLAGDALRARLRALLGVAADRPVPHHRNLRPVRRGEATYAHYAIETERDVRAILHKRLADPERAHSLDVAGVVRLYLPHLASEEDLASDPLAVALQAQGELHALDVRGLGESLPDEAGSFFQPCGMDYMFHGHALMFGESYLGRRVYDVLAAVDLLMAEGAEGVDLYGRGQGALLALCAAVLHPAVRHVTLKNGPTSLADWAQTPLVAWPSANFSRDALRSLDLDDLLAALGERVTVIEPWGPDMAPAPQS